MATTTAERIAELERELDTRRRVYPDWVRHGKLTQQQADHRTAVLQDLINELKGEPTAGDKSGRRPPLRRVVDGLGEMLRMMLAADVRRMEAGGKPCDNDFPAVLGEARRVLQNVLEREPVAPPLIDVEPLRAAPIASDTRQKPTKRPV